MIGFLRGKVLEKQPPMLLLDVQGVGYEINGPMSTFYHLPAIGEEASLYIHFVVREDAQLLYGFANKKERLLFRTLIKINGVGPKLALVILSGIESDAFVLCIEEGDINRLIKLPGIGKKTAERLVVEMRDKFKDWETSTHELDSQGLITRNAQLGPGLDYAQEAESALVALGYKPAEANRAILAVKSEGNSCEELIRLALKNSVK